MTPMPGDFACVHVSGDTGLLISIGEWLNGNGFSEYDHAAVFVGLADANGPYGYVMEAEPGGARLAPLRASQLADGNGYLWSTGKILLESGQRQAIVRNALLCRGIPYGWEDYLALAAHRLRIPAPGLREYIRSTRHMICSMMVDHVYLMAGIHLFNDGRWEGYVTPADLADLLQRRR